MTNKFKAGDKVKILSISSITQTYGNSEAKRALIGTVVDIIDFGSNYNGTPYAHVKGGFHFDFGDIEMVEKLFVISKDKSYKNSQAGGVKLKYIGRAFLSESGTVSISDEDGNVSGAIYKSLENDVKYKIIEVEPFILPEMYAISDSGTVSAIGHDMESKLYVTFAYPSCSTYEYEDVSIKMFHQMLSAKSKGTFFRTNIRSTKKFIKVS